MKIALINNLYTPYNRGGAEKIVEKIKQEATAMAHEVLIITTRPKYKEKTELEEKDVYYMPSDYYNLHKKGILYRAIWQISSFLNIKKAYLIYKKLKKEEIELVVTNNIMGLSWLSFLAIRISKIKHVHILHDIQLLHPSGLIIFQNEKIIDSLAAKIYQKIMKNIVESPDLVVSPSNWLLQEHLNKKMFTKSHTEVVINPVILEEQGHDEYKKEGEDKIKFLFIGQIEKHKGVEILINVFRRLRYDNIELNIIGEGSLKNKLQKEEVNIIWQGRKTRAEVLDFLKETDCLIVPSLCYENSPTVIYEASLFNISLIASNIGGAAELLDKDKDIAFYPNEERLEVAINQFMQNKETLNKLSKNIIGEQKYTQKIINLATNKK